MKQQLEKFSLFQSFLLPFVECFHFRIILQASFVYQEFHSLEERSSDGWRLFPQKNINWFGCRLTQLMSAARSVRTAFWVFAVRQAIWTIPKDKNFTRNFSALSYPCHYPCHPCSLSLARASNRHRPIHHCIDIRKVLRRQHDIDRDSNSFKVEKNPLRKSDYRKRLNRLPSRTSFNGAVLSVPSSDAKTSSVFALTVLVASRIAQFRVTLFAVPTAVALTLVVDTSTMFAAV